jgi:acetyl esterase/lipase
MSIFLMAVGCVFAKPQPDQVIEFKRVGDVSLNLHVFYSEGHSPEDQRPAIVFFFDGGWFGGTPSQFYDQSEYFASRGMVAISAEYRTQTGHQTTPQGCESAHSFGMKILSSKRSAMNCIARWARILLPN